MALRLHWRRAQCLYRGSWREMAYSGRRANYVAWLPSRLSTDHRRPTTVGNRTRFAILRDQWFMDEIAALGSKDATTENHSKLLNWTLVACI